MIPSCVRISLCYICVSQGPMKRRSRGSSMGILIIKSSKDAPHSPAVRAFGRAPHPVSEDQPFVNVTSFAEFEIVIVSPLKVTSNVVWFGGCETTSVPPEKAHVIGPPMSSGVPWL